MSDITPNREHAGEPDFGPDNSGHDTACDCKACLIDEWGGEVNELRAIVARYREGLRRVEREAAWCRDYAMCDHVGCESAHRAWETARAALDVESAPWPLRASARSQTGLEASDDS